jgi:hypothetical protein
MKKNMCRKGISRRGFLKFTAAAACLTLIPPFPRKSSAQTLGSSELFWVTEIPETMIDNYHPGFDALLNLMGAHGVKFYKSPTTETDESGALGMIAPNDVVLIKVNAQWKYRGCTNSDLIRGLIQRILEHPDGFTGEIVVFENGQGRGSLQCDTMGGDYPTGVHANAEDESHSFTYLVDTIFNDPRVSWYLLDPISGTIINSDNHITNGYRTYENVSYPCFTSRGGKRIELLEGIWNGSGYSQNLKLINIPVLKHHDTGGSEITASLKHFYGVLSMSDGQSGFRHYTGLGETCGKMVASVRTPVLNIVDAIWVSQGSITGYPKNTTTRMNQIIASQDPVALDYWAAKYILYPINRNQRHHPSFSGIATWLASAASVINNRGGLYNPDRGIFVQNATNDESKMATYEFAVAPPPPTVLSLTEGTLGTEISITGARFGTKAGKVLIGDAPLKIVNWTGTNIDCLVTRGPLPAGTYNVTIKPKPYNMASPKLLTSAFTVKAPEIDSLLMDHGSPGDEITIPGRFFSARKGKVYIEYEKDGQPRRVMCPVKSWAMDAATGASEIRFQVPKVKYSGPCGLIIANKAGTVETSFSISSSF